MLTEDQLKEIWISSFNGGDITTLLICDIAIRLLELDKKLSPPSGQDREAIKAVGRKESAESRKKLADTIRDILAEQVQASSSRQQLCQEKTVGEIIREYRKSAGMTQEKLSEKLGVSRSAIAKYEIGDIIPTIDRLIEIADAIGCRLDISFRKAN